MKIIIAGAGKIGATIARTLSDEGHDITVVDNDANVISYVSDEMDVICVEGSATSPETLETAGIKDTDVLIAAAETDEVNMICAITGKKLGAKYAVARIRDPQYNQSFDFFRSAFGIDTLVNPELECAREIARVLSFPGASRVDAFSAGNVEIAEYKILPGGKLDGKLLKELPSLGAKVLIAVVERGDKSFIPNGDFALQAGDRLSITGPAYELRRFFQALGAYKHPVRDVLIMGGGRIAVYLAKLLLASGIEVSIIDRNPETCDQLCDLLPGAKIICSDATHGDVLREEGIRNAGAFVALTGDDGVNIITSMYVRTLNKGKIVTKINHVHFADLLENADLDSIAIPKDIVAQQITGFIRGLDNSQGGSMETLHKLADGGVEAVEFRVQEGSDCIGIPLKDLRIRSGMLLTSIVHDKKSSVPGGNTVIQPGDIVVVVSKAGSLKKLNDLLEVTK